VAGTVARATISLSLVAAPQTSVEPRLSKSAQARRNSKAIASTFDPQRSFLNILSQ